MHLDRSRALERCWVAVGQSDSLLIGSCQDQLGHTSRLRPNRGPIKTVLAVQHGQIPPNQHF